MKKPIEESGDVGEVQKENSLDSDEESTDEEYSISPITRKAFEMLRQRRARMRFPGGEVRCLAMQDELKRRFPGSFYRKLRQE